MTVLEKVRIEKGFTLQKVADVLGITASSYSMYEKNQRKVPEKKADKIAEILNKKREEIFLPSTFTASEIKLKEVE